MRMGLADTLAHNADPSLVPVSVQELLSKEYAARRKADVFRPDR